MPATAVLARGHPVRRAALRDFDLSEIRGALTGTLGAHCGGVWWSGRGETRTMNVAVTTRAPERTLAAARAIAVDAGPQAHVAFPQVVWSLAELEAGRERFTAAADLALEDGPVDFV